MNPAPVAPRNRLRLGIWLGYWGALFVVSHIPPGAAARWSFHIADWLLHGMLYAVLAMVTLWSAGSRGPGAQQVRIPRGHVLAWFLALIGYAAFDEFTQPYFGRHCQLSDWISDVCGIALGLALGYAWNLRATAALGAAGGPSG